MQIQPPPKKLKSNKAFLEFGPEYIYTHVYVCIYVHVHKTSAISRKPKTIMYQI